MLVKDLKKILTLTNEYETDDKGNFLPWTEVWNKSFLMETEDGKAYLGVHQLDFDHDEEGVLDDLEVIHIDAALSYCDGPFPVFAVWVKFDKEIWENFLNF